MIISVTGGVLTDGLLFTACLVCFFPVPSRDGTAQRELDSFPSIISHEKIPQSWSQTNLLVAFSQLIFSLPNNSNVLC